MRFDSEKAFSFLKKEGRIATLRCKKYKEGSRVYITRKGKRVGRARILSVLDANEQNIRAMVSVSGFSSVDDWMREAKRLHGRKPKYIVLLEVEKWFNN